MMFEQNRKKENFEKKKDRIDELFDLTRAISVEVNNDIKKHFHIDNDLVNERGCISMDFFSREHGGIYTPEEIQKDKKDIFEKEVEWSGADDGNVQSFYKTAKNIEGREAIAQARVKDKEREKSSQMEMLTNAIFYKMLHERFIVVRSSTYDDYFSGVDNYLVDKETGDVVCAFDEVHDHARGDRKEEKWKRVEAISKGGKRIKYGIIPSEGKLIQKEIKNVPLFFLSLTTEELSRGIEGFSTNLKSPPSELEKNFFKKFLILLKEEYEKIKDFPMPYATKENLKKFRRALDTMNSFSGK